MVSYLAG